MNNDLFEKILNGMIEAAQKRDDQIDRLIDEIHNISVMYGQRGLESDERMRRTNEMIHEIIDDNKRTHESYRCHLKKLESDYSDLKTEKKQLLVAIEKLTERMEQVDDTNKQLLCMIKELAISNKSDNNINIH